MACIVCFSDNATIARMVQQGLHGDEYIVHILPASRLTTELRQFVQRLSPDIILMELSQSVDNLHLYFFLRSDQATRHVPVVFVSASARIAQQAEFLGADGYLQRPFAADQIQPTVAALLPPPHALVAA